MKKSFIILLHAGYWVLYLFLIFCFLLFVPGVFRNGHFLNPLRMLFAPQIAINFIVCGVICFYVFYAVLFPRFLFTKKFLLLFLTGSISCLASAFLCLLATSGFFSVNNFTLPLNEKLALLFFVAALSGIHGVIALVMKGFITWYGDIRIKEILTRKNYETELALIKSQINPHFLFNTINNIDILIQKDGEKASAFLNKLSGIMRFMLYETKTEKIPLQKELDYIHNYIELQRIRTNNPDYIQYHITGDAKDHQIAPMLFIPFIENAFTYADDDKSANSIKITVEISDQQLNFTCENSYSETAVTKDHGGLGNELMRKRLLLMYPNQHKLNISNKNGTYKANLILYFYAA